MESAYNISLPRLSTLGYKSKGIGSRHYENAPIKIYRQFFHQKNFQIKKFEIFLISAQNIDCGYSLEPPHQGGSNEYPQSMF